jgi:hypothetical protein
VKSCHRVPVWTMTGESTDSLEVQLATTVAEGKAIDECATQNGVAPRTAYYWAVRSASEAFRQPRHL